MKLQYFIAGLCTLIGCSQPEPTVWPRHLPHPGHAIAAWPADDVTLRCMSEMFHIELYIASEEEIGVECGTRDGWRIFGCYHSYPNARVAIARNVPMAPEFTAAHELAHWLFACTGKGARDDNHDDPRFHAAIERILGLWEADIATVEPEPVEPGVCPADNICDNGYCRDPEDAPMFSGPGEVCESYVHGGRTWEQESYEGQCVVTCGGGE